VSPGNVIRIGLILPFDAQSSTEKLYASMSDKEGTKSENNKIKEATQEALDFYEGLRYALNTGTSRQLISFYIFDSQNSDSLVQELVKDDSLKACDIIIGPTTANQAKTVAAFCKKNKIINIQPFVASKSFSAENPYLVRFMPTIDAHLQKEYEMVIDSFDETNIVIYTTKRERDISAARQLDTLFKNYNDINTRKLKYTFFNVSDSTVPVPKRALSYYLVPKQRNVVMMTCYDEPVVNSQLRTTKENVTVFGMPTWIDAEQIRADYLNKAEPYFTDNYYVDTASARVTDFISGYATAYNQKPSRYSYLGYDAMRYLSIIFDKYGKGFTQGFNNESYDGLGFSFHISPVIHTSKTSGEPVINYYTNTAMHLFQVSDYKVWLVR
jgi:ABC-type branched-subunit amino acid transport system substrate-binding protein